MDSKNFLTPAELFARSNVWETLKTSTRPIYLYGTGDGADKILSVMEAQGIPLAGIFVSDDFFRGQSFHGIAVTTLGQIEKHTSDFIVVVAFGSHLPEILDRVTTMAEKHSVFVPDVPVYGSDLFTPDYARLHYEELARTYTLLADDESRRIFTEIILYKLDGNLSHLLNTISPKQQTLASLLTLTDSEDYLDLGAYRGDTIAEFLALTQGGYHSITALEPDPRTYKKLVEYAHDFPRTHLLHYAATSVDGTIHMRTGRGRGAAQGGTTPVPALCVDSLQQPFSYIKMDVEGLEKEALLGATTTIQHYHPKLNIACYHRSEDIFVLPLLIHQLQPDYHIFLRRHACLPCWDLNLYCI